MQDGHCVCAGYIRRSFASSERRPVAAKDLRHYEITDIVTPGRRDGVSTDIGESCDSGAVLGNWFTKFGGTMCEFRLDGKTRTCCDFVFAVPLRSEISCSS